MMRRTAARDPLQAAVAWGRRPRELWRPTDGIPLLEGAAGRSGEQWPGLAALGRLRCKNELGRAAEPREAEVSVEDSIAEAMRRRRRIGGW